MIVSGSSVVAIVIGALAGVGVHDQVTEIAAFGGDRLREAPDAVAAHLGP